MRNLNDVDLILARMIELLCYGSFDDWAVVLEKIKKGFEVDPKDSSLKMLSMYGGVGSLNDVVLYRDGQPLVQENDELDNLRAQLYELCKNSAMGRCNK
ncbi:DUF6966 domain-containing protein [Pseudomonas oryziphila]|uniref:DUF6966 domain-containing protein n=1 Tax=Pseudomonas oryziphila TaxID=2894079 RepID=A0ABM7CTS5_9PSED|nr:hypothetical protein [Pseudomonas oryziphila]AZL74905.1 hypothetical protein EI693_18210 [Pseudomonas oryziphila]